MVIEKSHNNRHLPFVSSDSISGSNEAKETKDRDMAVPAGAPSSEEDSEKSFRERYSQELKTKRQQANYRHGGYNELEEERRSVRQQMMRTPGRRGEVIKDEELSKEFGRRFRENQGKHET
ncbi:MAG: hypothetical protein M3162_05215 [Thermoproteota archaeon]|nr:hypothetical protein [Thermoproteota archaeon]